MSFTVSFEQLNASLLNKTNIFFKKKNLTDLKFLNGSYVIKLNENYYEDIKAIVVLSYSV